MTDEERKEKQREYYKNNRSLIIQRVQRWYEQNRDKKAEYDRKRHIAKAAPIRERERLRYREQRRHIIDRQLKYAKTFPERVQAHNKVYEAIKSGRLQRQPCEKCGATNVEAHHDDYSKPLDVRWWCESCHKQHHAKVKIRSLTQIEKENQSELKQNNCVAQHR